MRADAAVILMGMGYEVDVDFGASCAVAGVTTITWLSEQPQPTESEIDTAADAAYAAIKQKVVRAAVKAAVIESLTDAVMAGTDKPEDVLAAAVAAMKDVKVEAETKP